jgi:hypothetical protein
MSSFIIWTQVLLRQMESENHYPDDHFKSLFSWIHSLYFSTSWIGLLLSQRERGDMSLSRVAVERYWQPISTSIKPWVPHYRICDLSKEVGKTQFLNKNSIKMVPWIK